MARKKKEDAEAKVKQVRRHTRKRYSAEDKIRIVIEGLQGESSIAELCRREGGSQATYYKWSKEFLEAGKQRLAGNTKRQADSEQVKELKREIKELKHLVAELSLDNRMLKKGSSEWKARTGKNDTALALREAGDYSSSRTL